MTVATAQKLLDIVLNLESLIQQIRVKQTFLKTKISKCQTEIEKEAIGETAVILGTEINSINDTLTMVEQLHTHLTDEEMRMAG